MYDFHEFGIKLCITLYNSAACNIVHLYIFSFYHEENALCGRATYVHCKAGRGRSTTIVICYLVSVMQNEPCIVVSFD